MLLRLVLVALLAWLVWMLWRKIKPREDAPTAPPPSAPRPGAGPEAMRRCAECGVHMPESQALPGRGGHFCSAAHRERFEAREPR